MIKEINKELVEVAILSGWESLLFESGTTLASLEDRDTIVTLEVTGQVRIADIKNNINYIDSEILDNEEIMGEIKSRTIDVSDKFRVDNNNWFGLVYRDKDSNYMDDIVYESLPESIDELEKDLVEFKKYFNSL